MKNASNKPIFKPIELLREDSPLSKGLKFCPTTNTIDTSILKEKFEKIGMNWYELET